MHMPCSMARTIRGVGVVIICSLESTRCTPWLGSPIKHMVRMNVHASKQGELSQVKPNYIAEARRKPKDRGLTATRAVVRIGRKLMSLTGGKRCTGTRQRRRKIHLHTTPLTGLGRPVGLANHYGTGRVASFCSTLGWSIKTCQS